MSTIATHAERSRFVRAPDTAREVLAGRLDPVPVSSTNPRTGVVAAGVMPGGYRGRFASPTQSVAGSRVPMSEHEPPPTIAPDRTDVPQLDRFNDGTYRVETLTVPPYFALRALLPTRSQGLEYPGERVPRYTYHGGELYDPPIRWHANRGLSVTSRGPVAMTAQPDQMPTSWLPNGFGILPTVSRPIPVAKPALDRNAPTPWEASRAPWDA